MEQEKRSKNRMTSVRVLWPRHAAYGILVPGPGIELVPPAVETPSLHHWTT